MVSETGDVFLLQRQGYTSNRLQALFYMAVMILPESGEVLRRHCGGLLIQSCTLDAGQYGGRKGERGHEHRIWNPLCATLCSMPARELVIYYVKFLHA